MIMNIEIKYFGYSIEDLPDASMREKLTTLSNNIKGRLKHLEYQLLTINGKVLINLDGNPSKFKSHFEFENVPNDLQKEVINPFNK